MIVQLRSNERRDHENGTEIHEIREVKLMKFSD